MSNRMTLRRSIILILGITMTCGAGISFAFDMGNMMNPSKWMGGNNDNRDYYEDGPGYGYGGPGYGYGAPGGYGGPSYGGPGGYGYPGYGYGGPGYGGPGGGYGYGAPSGAGTPGYGYGVPSSAGTPAGSAPAGSGRQSEIDALKERIRVLEGGGVR